MSFPSPITHNPKPFVGGFTLIELLVTISIFIFMTALIVSRYGAFNQGTLMTNLAYDMALTIRTAQTYGVSVKGIEDSSSQAGQGFSQTFSGSYGVHFDKSSGGPATSFLMFVDGTKGDNVYYPDVDASDISISSYNIKQGATISGLCASTSAGSPGSCINTDVLDIAFKRPDPSAIISSSDQSSQSNVPYNYAKITLTSADGTSLRSIIVRGNGQISVCNQTLICN